MEKKHPDRQLNAILPEFPNGYYAGKLLRSVGSLFFNGNRGYTVTAPGADGIAEACTLRRTERFELDDYERYYDHCLLDEFYNPIKRMPPIRNISSKDRHIPEVDKFLRSSHAQAAEILAGKTAEHAYCQTQTRYKQCFNHKQSSPQFFFRFLLELSIMFPIQTTRFHMNLYVFVISVNGRSYAACLNRSHI